MLIFAFTNFTMAIIICILTWFYQTKAVQTFLRRRNCQRTTRRVDGFVVQARQSRWYIPMLCCIAVIQAFSTPFDYWFCQSRFPSKECSSQHRIWYYHLYALVSEFRLLPINFISFKISSIGTLCLAFSWNAAWGIPFLSNRIQPPWRNPSPATNYECVRT